MRLLLDVAASNRQPPTTPEQEKLWRISNSARLPLQSAWTKSKTRHDATHLVFSGPFFDCPRSWLPLARSTRSSRICLRALSSSQPFNLPLIHRIRADTLWANSARPRAPSTDAARRALARRSTCRSSRLKSKRLTRNWFLRQSACKGKLRVVLRNWFQSHTASSD